jgi:hypothetical protein
MTMAAPRARGSRARGGSRLPRRRLGELDTGRPASGHGVVPVAYGDGVADRIRAAAPGGVDAFIDTYGDGYVELALALGVAAERTSIRWHRSARPTPSSNAATPTARSSSGPSPA